MRTFSADEIAKILRSHGVPEFELADGLKAVQMATSGGLVWTIHRGDKEYQLRDAQAAELVELSEILWTKIAPQFLASREILDDKLTPDALLEKSEDVLDPMTPDNLKEVEDPAEGLDALVPDALREKKDDPNLEPDPTGLVPDWAREKKGPAKPSLEDDLTPDAFRDAKNEG